MLCVDCALDIETQDGQVVCETCAPATHTRCVGCDEWHPADSYCDRCTTCDRCDATVPAEETVETTRGSTICDPCRQGWYWQCSSCEGWNRDGADCGNGCCDPDSCSCGECRPAAFAGLVHDYGYKPTPVFHGAGSLFLGPEIEVEAPDCAERACAEIAYAHLGDLGYLKVDGSLCNGFEIVTHPMSYPWAIANFPWPMLTQLAEAGCFTTSDTGIHVHVSRTGFDSPCHVYRWMKFIYRNQPQVTTLARRSSPDWAAFTDNDRRAVKYYAKGARGERYRAINTNNYATFELRIFASSLDPGEVKAAFGFTAGSVEYTRALTVPAIAHGGGWAWKAFAAWLADRPAYRPLTQQLEALQCVC